MKALSGRQPWWWAILSPTLASPKRIDNRSWNTHYRGPILLHAAQAAPQAEVEAALTWMIDRRLIQRADWPGLDSVQRGGFVGRCNLVDVIPPGEPITALAVVRQHGVDLRWWMRDKYGFVLTDVEPLPFTPWPGALSLFNVPEHVTFVTDPGK
jgi:hypothetical protein